MTVGGAVRLDIADRCTACGLCLVTCPEGALVRAPRRPEVIASRCTGCLACTEICPVDAIAVTIEGLGSRLGHEVVVPGYSRLQWPAGWVAP